MSRTSRKKEKPYDHISLLLMQRRDAVMQPRHLHLKRYVRHLKAVHIQLECSLLSGDRSPVAFVDWWDGFLEPCGLAPPSPPPVLHDRRLSCCLLWLTELSNYISNEAAKCEKTRQLYSLQTFFHPPPRLAKVPRDSLREANSIQVSHQGY